MKELIESFLRYLADERRYSPNTIIGYRNDLQFLEQYLKEQKVNHINEVTPGHLQGFVAYVRRQLQNGPAAQARKLFSVRSFFRYLFKAGKIQNNPAADLEPPKLPRRLPVFLSEKEAQRLLEMPRGKWAARDKAIFTVFLFCGLRVSELCNLNLVDVDLDNGTLRVIGKGDQERIVPLAEEVIEALKEYLKERPSNNSQQALFLSYRKTRITARGVQKILKNYAKAAQIKKVVSPHKLRHTCATLLYEEGSLLELQRLLGHKSPATTQIYAHINDSQVRRLVHRHPLSSRH